MQSMRPPPTSNVLMRNTGQVCILGPSDLGGRRPGQTRTQQQSGGYHADMQGRAYETSEGLCSITSNGLHTSSCPGPSGNSMFHGMLCAQLWSGAYGIALRRSGGSRGTAERCMGFPTPSSSWPPSPLLTCLQRMHFALHHCENRKKDVFQKG